MRNRHSTRTPGHDYAADGWYFVTLNAHGRQPLFGEIKNHRMVLSSFGQIVMDEWERTSVVRPNVTLDIYQIMPDHFHAILHISEDRKGASRYVPGPEKERSSPFPGDHKGVSQYAPAAGKRIFRSPSNDLGAILRGFKSASTKTINILRGTPGIPVWQRNYYDHIIRDAGRELENIRRYIRLNPERFKGVSQYARTPG